MSQSQSINVQYPKMHGNAPRNLSMVINIPLSPKNNGKVKSLKDVFSLLNRDSTNGKD